MPGYWEWMKKTPIVRAILNEAVERQTIRDVHFHDYLIVPGSFNWQTRDLHLSRKLDQCFAYTLGTIAHEVMHSLQDCPQVQEDILEMEREAYLVGDMVLLQVPLKLFKGKDKRELQYARAHRKNFKKWGAQYCYDWAEYCYLGTQLRKEDDSRFMEKINNPPPPFYKFSWREAELI